MVRWYQEDTCEPCTSAFLQDMELTGAWLRNNTVFVHAGSLESAASLAVSVNGGSYKEITDPSSTDFLSDVGVSACGEITQEEPAELGPGCRFRVRP